MMTQKLFLVSLAIFSLCSCQIAPKIPFYDRHTVMEAEAAGDWPDFEQDLLQKSVHKGPVFLPKDTSQKGRSRALNILHGEMTERVKN